MREFIAKVSAQYSGMRLDLFLLEFAKNNKLGFSRTAIQKLIVSDGVVSKKPLRLKARHKVKEGDEFKITFEDKKDDSLSPENIPLDIIYEDDYLAVINKPAGLVVHPAPGNRQHTLANALLHRFKKLSSLNPQRPGIVHRLDKDTSGLLVIAKDNATHLDLTKQFAEHSIKRKYCALVKGRVELDENIIELPIRRHPYKRKNMAVGFSDKAKYARTHYRTLKRTADSSLLELEPFTGRTHQLRVHLAFIGHPILGDIKYGKNDKFIRLALHAKYLGFLHPQTKKFLEFRLDLPKEFTRVLKSRKI